jgi:uncharacterized protein (DUF2141 family)
VRAWLVLFALAASTEALADSPPAKGTLTVNLSQLRSNKGKVGCTLYDGPRGFPTDPTAAIQTKWCAIDGTTSSCRFDALAAGTYAVACFHDENDNSKMDRGLFGIPSEGVVVSNHAKGSFGPPKWDDAKFQFPGAPSHIDLRMGY